MRGDQALMQMVNVTGTRNVVESAVAAKVERMVPVSTNSIYGYSHNGDVTEDMGPTPGRDAYALTKSEGEAVVREVAETHGLSYSIIRPGNMYGPRSNMWTAGMFKLARRKPTIYLGNGGGTIPVIHIDDIVDLMVLLATHPAADGEAFNATPEPAPTWREFIGGYSKLSGHQKWLGIPLWPVKLIANTVSALVPSNSAAREMPRDAGILHQRQRDVQDDQGEGAAELGTKGRSGNRHPELRALAA
jgi:nucleoside-diphosphate-sugar epimerase